VTPTAAERTAAIDAFGGGNSGRIAALRSVTDSASVRAVEARISFVLAEYFGYPSQSNGRPGFQRCWLSILVEQTEPIER
jgi:hypothetical protein